jgi:hypothetical protein
MKKERKESLFRIIVLIVSGIILSVWYSLIKILILVHFFIALFTAKRNKGLAEFCEYWNTEFYRFTRYITFVTNERPFPFTKISNRMSKFK